MPKKASVAAASKIAYEVAIQRWTDHRAAVAQFRTHTTLILTAGNVVLGLLASTVARQDRTYNGYWIVTAVVLSCLFFALSLMAVGLRNDLQFEVKIQSVLDLQTEPPEQITTETALAIAKAVAEKQKTLKKLACQARWLIALLAIAVSAWAIVLGTSKVL